MSFTARIWNMENEGKPKLLTISNIINILAQVDGTHVEPASCFRLQCPH
jgi:hypothetical protein